jgi:flavin reductase (DIM6/NTAB) family NADH-FMN oxidoreductase RutF
MTGTPTDLKSNQMLLAVNGPNSGRDVAPPTDTAQLRCTFGCFPTRIAAVSARLSDGPVGTLVSSLTSVSPGPPLVSICIVDTTRSWSQLRPAPRPGISVLAGDHHDLGRRFTTPIDDRFADLPITTTPEGAVLLPEATAWLDCSIQQQLPTADHTVVLRCVEASTLGPARRRKCARVRVITD